MTPIMILLMMTQLFLMMDTQKEMIHSWWLRALKKKKNKAKKDLEDDFITTKNRFNVLSNEDNDNLEILDVDSDEVLSNVVVDVLNNV